MKEKRINPINTILLSFLCLVAIFWSVLTIVTINRQKMFTHKQDSYIIWQAHMQTFSKEKQIEILTVQRERNQEYERVNAIHKHYYGGIHPDSNLEAIKRQWKNEIESGYQLNLKQLEIEIKYMKKIKDLLDSDSYKLWFLVRAQRAWN